MLFVLYHLLQTYLRLVYFVFVLFHLKKLHLRLILLVNVVFNRKFNMNDICFQTQLNVGNPYILNCDLLLEYIV
jgi:hypothetical protein